MDIKVIDYSSKQIYHNPKASSSNVGPETSPGDGMGGVRGVSPQIQARNPKTDSAQFLPNLQFTITIVKFMISAMEDEDTNFSEASVHIYQLQGVTWHKTALISQ